MTTTLLAALTALLVVGGLTALVRYARRDTFGSSAVRNNPHDELGYRNSPLFHRPA